MLKHNKVKQLPKSKAWGIQMSAGNWALLWSKVWHMLLFWAFAVSWMHQHSWLWAASVQTLAGIGRHSLDIGKGCVQWRHLGEAQWWFSWRAWEAWLLTLAQRYCRVVHRAKDRHRAIMQELISEDQWGMSLSFSGEVGEKLRWKLLSVPEAEAENYTLVGIKSLALFPK